MENFKEKETVKVFNKIQYYLELSKVKITVAVAFTTITGYFLAKKQFDLGFFLPTLGLFLVACGASVINHLEEIKTDRLMQRTKNRPLPSKKVSVAEAVTLAVLEITAGSLILYFSAGAIPALLSFIALFWYNVIYALLKRVTPHAVIPGSVIGAIPPVIGWLAGGGELFSLETLFLATFFFMWQVPHFYILALKYAEQYAAAGLPTIMKKSTYNQFRKSIIIWIALTIASAIIIARSALNQSLIVSIGIYVASLCLLIIFINFYTRKKEEIKPGKYFMYINYYVLFIIMLLNLNGIIY